MNTSQRSLVRAENMDIVTIGMLQEASPARIRKEHSNLAAVIIQSPMELHLRHPLCWQNIKNRCFSYNFIAMKSFPGYRKIFTAPAEHKANDPSSSIQEGEFPPICLYRLAQMIHHPAGAQTH